ncbi:GerMN domain-containing protein [Catelliglobosispora koreensis]|uniref:GerMN domain-containing protein n=1 Tax=Catelliglobosispora koreensis TaxID=129052 RepID=UPI0003742D9A|nr:GerMN domain-containing protein [Catelliglobosispora koreensis]
MKRYLWLMRVIAVAITAPMAASACGVSVQAEPHPVELPGRSTAPATSQTPAPQGELTQTLYLIRDSHLVAVTRNTPKQLTAAEQLASLLSGPTSAEQQQGLSSSLLGTDLGLSVQNRNGQAIVELATSLEGTGRTDDILAFAQIVCTLTSRGDIHTVTFTRAGEPVEVPRANSSLSRDPLTAADYTPLIASK